MRSGAPSRGITTPTASIAAHLARLVFAGAERRIVPLLPAADRLPTAAPGAPPGPPRRRRGERRRRPTGYVARHAGLAAGLGTSQSGVGVHAVRLWCSRAGRSVRG